MWYKRRSHAQEAGTCRAGFVRKPGKDLARRSPRLCSVHAHENATCSYILLPRAVILSTTISRLFSLESFCSNFEHFEGFCSICSLASIVSCMWYKRRPLAQEAGTSRAVFVHYVSVFLLVLLPFANRFRPLPTPAGVEAWK